MTLWDANHRAFWSKLNAVHTERELEACKDLFAKVESKPLTDEQSRAVVCFDNRVQVVASAGSGKTSTMVAKAAYAIHRGFVPPERVILLAFNKQAAEELTERAAKSFDRSGMEGVSVEASTFHALGLHYWQGHRRETGHPRLGHRHRERFSQADRHHRSTERPLPAFRTQWDLFRFVFGRDLPTFGSPDLRMCGTTRATDARSPPTGRGCAAWRRRSWLTGSSTTVWSIATKRRYKFKTADEDHRQYRPDFYYPGIDLYHEHFALDAHGEPPPSSQATCMA